MPGALQAARPLPELLEALHDKGLRRGVAPARGRPEPARGTLSTGHPALDAALGDGLPRGSLGLFEAELGTGATTLALHVLAATQRAGGLTAYVDLPGTLDPAAAVRLGLALEWLLIVHPGSAGEALELAAWLARSRLVDALVLDLEAPGVSTSGLRPLLERLPGVLARTSATVLLLADRPLRDAAMRAAGVRLRLERLAWLAVGRDLVGQRVRATVTRHRWAAPGGQAELELWFGEGRRLDALGPSLATLHERAAAQHEPAAPRVALRVLSA